MSMRRAGLLFAALILPGSGACRQHAASGPARSASEVEQLFLADQADRTPPADGRQLTDAEFQAVAREGAVPAQPALHAPGLLPCRGHSAALLGLHDCGR